MDKLQKQGYVYALCAVCIWSGFILVSRMGGISSLLAYDVIAIRYTTCAVLLLPIWLFWKRFNLLQTKLIITSLIGGLAYALFAFEGFEYAPASHAAVLLPSLLPVFIALIATILDKQKLSSTKCLGIAVITLGVSALLMKELSNLGAFSKGHLLLVCAAICWAIFSVLVSRWKINPWEATISLALITCVIYLPIYLLFLPKNIESTALTEIAIQAFYQGVMATIVQMVFYVRAVELISAPNMGAVMAIVPVLAGFSAIPIFGEALTSELIIALLLVSIGVLIANSTNAQSLSIYKLVKSRI